MGLRLSFLVEVLFESSLQGVLGLLIKIFVFLVYSFLTSILLVVCLTILPVCCLFSSLGNCMAFMSFTGRYSSYLCLLISWFSAISIGFIGSLMLSSN